ncbi:hypothetical protein MKX01_002639 [Papaver californicum]|nr:hypothetical protein MKX01_002639 [Papaver californicum]
MVSLLVRPYKSSVVMQLNRGSVESSSLGMKTTMTSVVDGQLGKDLEIQEQEIKKPIKAAKIHDFYFGIPFDKCISAKFFKNVIYGGLILSGGFVGFLFSRNPLTLAKGILYGGKHFHNYSLTKKFFPAGFYAIMSVAMLCFYSYVMISGGNPPPKKKLSASSPTS